jgi:trehalose 6-phosphate synthase/phosphatase
MERLLIASNRLPLTINVDKNNNINIKPSVGGLATGMKSVYKNFESIWFGWPGFDESKIKDEIKQKIEKQLKTEKCHPVYINKRDEDLYYSGFSNKTIWPLFHYFMQFAVYEDIYWDAYMRVNEQFAKEILKFVKKGDKIWIHDYHLLLLPKLIHDKFPDVSIGFFLHIPFPSYELFRVLPWRNELLEGILGADLIGFHAYEYERHFLSSVRRLFGFETYFNQIMLKDRIVKTDAFPMGIDFDKFHNASLESQKKPSGEKSEIKKEIEKLSRINPDRKFILSIDRLDYSKGIPNRLLAYEHFLNKYPEYREKVTLVMLAVPSRINVRQYKIMKSEIDELVGRINGRYATISWTPVWYFYRSLPRNKLIELYNSCEVALITPVRDGMNLVAKEYIAARTDGSGVLILSEMAGASKEMNEALIINPNNKNEIADAIKQALEMPLDEQKEMNRYLQDRIKRYNVNRWASDFIDSLNKMSVIKEKHLSKKINLPVENEIISVYRDAEKRILFLDYDGTLVNYEKNPQKAMPDEELYDILDTLSNKKETEIVLVTGRSKSTFDEWFSSKNYTLIAEHGIWLKEAHKDWVCLEELPHSDEWKELVLPVVQFYTDRTPASLIEEKNHSISWHYRNSDPDLANSRVMELKEELSSLIPNLNLEIIEGNKVLEIKVSTFNKGKAAMNYLRRHHFDFVLAVGDDYSDEYLYEELPRSAFTIKAGINKTLAKYHLGSFQEVRDLLKRLSDVKQKDVTKPKRKLVKEGTYLNKKF